VNPPPPGLVTEETTLATLLGLLAPDGHGLDSASPPQERKGRFRRAKATMSDHWTVLPATSRPRYLVPVRPRRVAAAVRLSTSNRPRVRVANVAVSAALRTGTARMLPGHVGVARGTDEHPSLMHWLESRLELGELSAAIRLGAPVPYRKPVLQLIDQSGTTRGYAKLAVDAPTSRRVRHEAAFLAMVPTAHAGLAIPTVLLDDSWKGRAVLVISDLGPDLDDTIKLELTADAIDAIARLGPYAEHAVLDSPWWQGSGERIGRLTGPNRRLLERCHRIIGPRLARQRWSFGAWHGDLNPRNAHWRDGELCIWNWERAGGPVPLGFDAVHVYFHAALAPRRRKARDAADAVLDNASGLLSGLGYEGGRAATLVDAYLLELRIRLAEDAAAGALGGADWVAHTVSDAILAMQP
jgi:hypothetical protein